MNTLLLLILQPLLLLGNSGVDFHYNGSTSDSRHTLFPLKHSDAEQFLNSFGFFDSLSSNIHSFGERSLSAVSGNIIYNNIVQSSMVVKVIVLLISQASMVNDVIIIVEITL